jgi:hypothetical protein
MMTQAAIRRLAYLSSVHRLTREEICRVLRDARAAHTTGQPVILASVERAVRIVVAARTCRAA